MSKGTKVRTVRIDDALWEAAQTKAQAEGTNISEVIRGYLQAWLNDSVDAC